jgi:protoheme IX farnesyltransferase
LRHFLESATTEINFQADYSKMSGFFRLTKFRLGALVVFSALITYLTVTPHVEWIQLLALGIGGFLVTSSANGFNKIVERGEDRLMERTRLRPLPAGVLNVSEAFAFCSLCGISGTALLWMFVGPIAGSLGFLSIVLYALVYTPLKKLTPFSVFAGAFPGAIPTLIGGFAGSQGLPEGIFFTFLLFLIQFVWQFPHFWSLAWFNHEDYSRAGFHLLPSRNGKDRFTAFQIMVYCFFLLLVSLLPFLFRFTGWLSALACGLCGLAMLLQSINFFRVPTDEQAKRLFLVTLVYLPLVQLALMTRA